MTPKAKKEPSTTNFKLSSMTTLRVKFPSDWPGWSIPEYNLTSVKSPLSGLMGKAATVCVHSEAHSDYSSDSPVFRASVIESEGTTLALKFAMREDLIPYLVEEAGVYAGTLEPLQGRAIPHCYGLYVGFGEGGQSIACLVLEYWGECIARPFEDLSLETRYADSSISYFHTSLTYDPRLRILGRLGEIHRQGLLHGDFAERNVLELDGDIRIIDFDQTENHKCECDMDFRPGEKLPDAEEFGCEQLWEICRSEMRIWD